MEAVGRKYVQYTSRADVFTVWNLADLHILNKACAFDDIERDIKKIKDDPFALWVGGGDFCEYIGTDDKRFDPSTISDIVPISKLGMLGKFSAEFTRDLFMPIKDKCLGLVFGNHEIKYEIEKKQQDLHAWLCNELDVDNLHYSALFDLIPCNVKTKKLPIISKKQPAGIRHSDSFRFFIHHGAGFANTPGGKLNKLIQFMNAFDAEIYLIGHVHDQTGKRIVTIGANADCTKLTQKRKLGVISGSYLKTYEQGVTTYGEQRGYSPTVLGSARVTINPDKREFSAEI